MSIDDVIQTLDENNEVIESYVLLREIKAGLNVGHPSFHPFIRIKIYKSNVLPATSFHFEVSHNVQTPEQISPYYPSRTSSDSEAEAISQAISTTTNFIKSALSKGHEPADKWLIPNEYF